MKRITLLIVFLSLAVQVHATVPLLINYSGKLTDNSGNLIPDGNYAMEFNLYDAPSGGNLVWWEVYNVSPGITVRGGSFNVILGGLRSLNNVPFDKPYYLEFGFANLTTLNYTVFPRQQLLSTPYSVRAGISDQVADNCITSSKIADGTISTCDIADNTITAAKILNGTITGSKIASGSITGSNISTTAGQRITYTNIESGTIQGSNIAALTIGGGNIANGTIDQTKATFAPKMFYRNDIGSTSYNQITNPIIACGHSVTNSSGYVQVDLTPFSFTQVLSIICEPDRGTDYRVNTQHYNGTNSGFSVYAYDSENGAAGATMFHWIAIGY